VKIKVTILWGVLLALALTASLALTACGGSETDKRAATGQSSDVETIQVGVLPVEPHPRRAPDGRQQQQHGGEPERAGPPRHRPLTGARRRGGAS